MAELATIARPYAEAVFRLAQPKNLAVWSELLDEMAQIASVPELAQLAHNPRAENAQVGEIFLAALKSAITPEVKNLVAALVENGRLTLVPEIAAQFQTLKNNFESSADAEIVSAFPMSDAQVAELKAGLEKKFGRKLNTTITVDQSLIGGVKVTVGDEVLDTSVRARLEHMHTVLAA
jgi:F-type H+-transporting ATPase subunit delta